MVVLLWSALDVSLGAVFVTKFPFVISLFVILVILDLIVPVSGHCVMRKPTLWFPTWSDTNQSVQLQKMARGLKFRI